MNELYTDPKAMTPLYPEDSSGGLEVLALELIEKSARLSGILNKHTMEAIADFLRPMNSYYSNLIEGHDTHPIDINKALNNDYVSDAKKRNLQLEAVAHIVTYKSLSSSYFEKSRNTMTSSELVKYIHELFYKNLPKEFRNVKSVKGTPKTVIPGNFRIDEVGVGKHLAPAASSVHVFMERFDEGYGPNIEKFSSKTNRIIAIATSHHRLVWIHPFLDGNGRVVRLFSDTLFMNENLHASGLWSISRGLARYKQEYRTKLANADLQRYNDYDGRGNLSNKHLIEFCTFFLKIAIDQIEFMAECLDMNNMLGRIERFCTLMEHKGKLAHKATYILTDVFLKGKISKADAMRITNTSDKTLKNIADELIKLGLLLPKKEPTKNGVAMMYYAKYPIMFSPILFPGLYPTDKEIDMLEMI